ncbi:Tat pathway signal protein [Streptomyces sp. NPDC056773]|uniref:Tat pathway signal protein n=1 Tax=unclassified Streptomyces TaxID=2593676 RepID=UPI0036AA9DC3
MLNSARSRAGSRSTRRLLVPALLAALLVPVAPTGSAFAATPPVTAPKSAAPAPTPAAQAEPVQRPASPVHADKAAESGPAPAGSADEPCTPLALTPLGEPGTAAGATTIPSQGTACFTVAVTTPGLHQILVSTPYLKPSLSSGGSQIECGDVYGYRCELAAGTYTLSVFNSSSKSIKNPVSLVPLMDGPACPAVAGTRYDSAPATGRVTGTLGIVCHAFTAAPRERIAADFQLPGDGSYEHWITDGTGKRICASEPCVLPAGAGGYRVLATVSHSIAGFPSAYSLKVRRLSNPEGCVPVAMTAYGSAPAQAAPQTGCRTFTPAATDLYDVRGVDAQGQASGITVYSVKGSVVCSAGQDCALTAGTPYTLITDVAVRILSRTATEGCENGVVLARNHKGTLTAPGEVDCLNLPVPQGAHIAVLSDEAASITVIDAKGAAFCTDALTDGTCTLGGTAPYRALVSKQDPSQDGDVYRLVVHRTDAPSACRTFLPGDFSGKPARMSLKTSADVFADCLSIAAGDHSALEIFQVQRISGDAYAVVRVFDTKGKQVCFISSPAFSFTGCDLTPKVAYTVLVRSQNTPAEFALTRLDVTSTARGCVATPATAVGGPSTSRAPAKPGTFLCHQVTTASASDTLHLNARDAQGTVRLVGFKANGEGVCDYFDAGCAVTGSTRYQVLAQVPEGKTAAPAYRLDAMRIGTAAGPAPECVKVTDVSKGFGPLTATLSEQKTAICAVLPTVTGDRFDLKFTPTGTYEQSPTPWLYDRSDLKNGCWGYTCSLPVAAPPTSSRPSTLVIGLPEKPAKASTAVRLEATCSSHSCGQEDPVPSAVGPSTVGRGKVTMTVTGTGLNKDVEVYVSNDRFGVQATIVSIASDRRSMTVALDLTEAPLGPLSVRVTARGDEWVKSTVTVVAPIRSTAAPTIKGTAVVGGKVTATTGSWSPAADSHTYRWYADGKSISGATAASYTLPSALQGKKLTVVVTARKAGHPTVKATSTAVTVKGAAPEATKAPSITGTAKVGSVLTANRGTWTPAPTSYDYQWYADGKAITGATRTTFTPTSAQRGQRITVKVTAHRTGHLAGTATSGARGPVAG